VSRPLPLGRRGLVRLDSINLSISILLFHLSVVLTLLRIVARGIIVRALVLHVLLLGLARDAGVDR
jgi:hypothetical protein